MFRPRIESLSAFPDQLQIASQLVHDQNEVEIGVLIACVRLGCDHGRPSLRIDAAYIRSTRARTKTGKAYDKRPPAIRGMIRSTCIRLATHTNMQQTTRGANVAVLSVQARLVGTPCWNDI
jgi:hypothetical protein